MADVKWIKITTDIFDDEKILLIETLPDAYAIITVWFKLLCLAGKQNNSGVFLLGRMPYTDKMLATIFRMKEATVTMALQTFEQFGMIEIIDGVITIPNWGKHQSLDQLEDRKKYMKNYMTEYRKKQKAITEGKPYSKVNSKVNVNCADIDTEREGKKEKKKEVEVVVMGADSPDNDDNQLHSFGKVILTDNQIDDLLERMEIDVFDDYCDRLSDFIDKTGATVKSHYSTILKWYNEDRMVKA